MKRYNLFKEFSHVEEKDIVKYRQPVDTLPLSDDTELDQLIFAPDPVTGIPRSDLAVMMSKDIAPEVSQYIQDHLMRSHAVASSLGATEEDADLALISVRAPGQSIDDYVNGLRELVARGNKDS